MTVKQVGKELIFFRDRPPSRVELSYANLMAWFTVYCPVRIQPGEEPPEGKCYTHFHCLENFQWVGQYLVGVQRMVSFKEPYSLFRYFPHIFGTKYSDEFHDTEDNQIPLGWAPSSGWSALDLLI